MQTPLDESFSSIKPGSNPAFGLTEETRLRLGDRFDTLNARRYLTSRVARDHLDLRAHLQRIYLVLDDDTREDLLFGALLDLFLALGDKGRELREATLELARPRLDSDDHAFLAAHLDRGLQRLDVLPIASGSILDHALFGNSHLVERQRAELLMDADTVDIAIMHLEHGDVDAARTLLEEALVKDPSQSAVETELLEIYRRTRDEAGFLSMRKQLQAKGATLSADWNEL